MTDQGQAYDYPPVVRLQINDEKLEEYAQAAEFLNAGQFDVVCLQHEFGIFGGEAGGHIMALLSRLTMPIVTTLHTVLAEPKPAQRACSSKIVDVSSKVVVMAEKGRELLRAVYEVAARQDRRSFRTAFPISAFVEPDAAKPSSASRQAGHPDIRPALAEQGHRGHDRCHASDPQKPPRCRIRRARRDASQSRAP